MSVTAAKSKAPIESTIVAPINESTTFKPENTIIFRIGPSDLLYWLIQDSYFVFDIDWSIQPGADPINQDAVIRNSSMFVDNVRLLHAGNEVYYAQYNIAQQFLDYTKTGEDFLNSQFYEWTNHTTYEKTIADDQHLPLILRYGEWNNVGGGLFTLNKKGIVIHVSQILKCFSQIENFPLKYLTQQLEIRFQLAKPEDFVCGANRYNNLGAITIANKNFEPLRGNVGLAATGAGCSNEIQNTLFNNMTYTISNCRLYMFGAQVEPAYDAVQSASNAAGQGTVWKYQMPRINLRNEPQRNDGYLISNFQCITENTDKLFIWAVRGTNLATTIVPKITNCNLRFGPYQIPKSPTAEPNWLKPALYKTLVDDTLEYSTAYYTSTNKDLYKSYNILAANARKYNAANNASAMPHDTHIILAGSYTTDDGQPGSNSKAWNSQYNLHYQLEEPEAEWTWVLAVDTDYVLTLRGGMLSSTNI